MQIIYKIEPFDFFQKAIVLNEETDQKVETLNVPMEQIVTFTPEYCYSKEVNKIIFVGNKKYIKERLVEPLEINLLTNYHKNNQKIEIEVMSNV